jgi:hypothetical protein
VRRRSLAGLDAAPKGWHRRKPPKREKLCYRRKSDALRLFLDANTDTVESWGGAGRRESCEEFDAVNHQYAGKGKPCARTIAQAVWYVLTGSGQGGGPPFCLDELDLEALNRTSPGQYHGGFRLPDAAEQAIVRREEERYYEDQAREAGEIDDCYTAWRNGKGRFRKGRGASRKRVRRCVCRNERGHFKKCGENERCVDEVPF